MAKYRKATSPIVKVVVLTPSKPDEESYLGGEFRQRLRQVMASRECRYGLEIFHENIVMTIGTFWHNYQHYRTGDIYQYADLSVKTVTALKNKLVTLVEHRESRAMPGSTPGYI